MSQKVDAFRAWRGEIALNEDDWHLLQDAAGIIFLPNDKESISTIINNYYSDCCGEIFSLPAGEAKKNLEQIMVRAKTLLTSLETLDWLGNGDFSGAIEISKFGNSHSDPFDPIVDEFAKDIVKNKLMTPQSVVLARLIEDIYERQYGVETYNHINNMVISLARLVECIDLAKERIGVSSGACGDGRTTIFLVDLHNAFSYISGTLAISKAFLAFAETMCKLVARQSTKDFGEHTKTPIMRIRRDAIRKRIEQQIKPLVEEEIDLSAQFFSAESGGKM